MNLRCNRWVRASDVGVTLCGQGPVVLAYRLWRLEWNFRCQEHDEFDLLPPDVEATVVRGEENILAEVVSDALARIA